MLIRAHLVLEYITRTRSKPHQRDCKLALGEPVIRPIHHYSPGPLVYLKK